MSLNVSLLLPLSAVSGLHSRTGDDLLSNSQDMLSPDRNSQHQTIAKRGAGRENLEYTDYSGTGPNNRHTPEPPSGQGGNN
ncbi:hypothetical protein D5086_016154 [Populus alba]|uniref:Uncharacterized protein n=1 Tax=Populus alba TaxID=43335 RepID=A0ACC4BTS0_POPAL